MSDDAKNERQVGYGRPPVHTRFRKGQSGNPAGKRRRSEAERVTNMIWSEAMRTLTLREGDKVVKMPALQVVLRSQITAAAKGNGPAQRAVVRAAQEIEAAKSARVTAGRDTKVLSRDAGDLTDEDLMAILATAQPGQ
jgi:Family of unknown function (DUF5681)